MSNTATTHADMRTLAATELEAVGGGQFIGQFAPPSWRPWTPFLVVFGSRLGWALYRQSREYYPPLH